MTKGLYKITLILAIVCCFVGASVIPSISGNILELNNLNDERDGWDVEYVGSYDTQGNAHDVFVWGDYASMVDDKSTVFQIVDVAQLVNSPVAEKVKRYRESDGAYTMFVSDYTNIDANLNYGRHDDPQMVESRRREPSYKGSIIGKLNSNVDIKNKAVSRESNVATVNEDRIKSSLLNSGNTLYVGGSGANNYTSIQAAIDEANDEDTVFVYDDSSPYYEHVLVDKSIHLIGEDKDSTVIDGSKLNDFLDTVNISADDVYMDGFTVKNNQGYYYQAGVKIMGDHVTVSNCIVHNNEWVGIHLFGSSYGQLFDCELYSNLIAIRLYDSMDNEIRDGLCYNNADAITLFHSSHNNQIIDCTIYGNGFCGIHVQRSSGNQIVGCLCYDGYNGISLAYAPNTKIRGNILNNNYENFGIGSSVLSDFYCDIDTSNTINGKPISYILEQNDLVFDETIEIGFLALISCRNISVKNLEIANNFQGIVCAGISNCNFENCDFYNNGGHGMFFVSSSNNKIKNCVCKNNFFSGIYLVDSSNSNTISDNTISNIQACGIWLEDSTSNFISRHIINNCGAGISLEKSADSVLRDNEMVNCGLVIDGISLSEYINDVDTSNSVNGKPIYYYIDKNEITVPQDAGEVILINCNYCEVSNLDLSDGTVGIELAYSSYNIISGNTFKNNNLVAIDLDCSSNNNNTIEKNVIQNNGYGIDVDSSCNNTIQDNTLDNNGIELSLDFSSSNIIKENNIQNSIYGIYVRNSNSNTINYNTIQDNLFSGIYLLYSKDNILRENEMVNCGLLVYGISLSEYINDVDTSNSVNRKPIYYYIDKNEITVPQDVGEVILINCNYCEVSNLDLSDGTVGIELAYSSHNIISENVLNNNSFAGIYLDSYSDDNTLKINTIKDNGYGIYLQVSNNNNIDKNNIKINYDGIYFYFSKSNTISGNTLLYNGVGVHLDHFCNSNMIYHNNFIDNSLNAWDERKNVNSWDNGEKGNYWDDYKERYPDARRIWIKGIWDTPYNIRGGDDQDKYPLIKTYSRSKSKYVNLPNSGLLQRFFDQLLLLQQLLKLVQAF